MAESEKGVKRGSGKKGKMRKSVKRGKMGKTKLPKSKNKYPGYEVGVKRGRAFAVRVCGYKKRVYGKRIHTKCLLTEPIFELVN